MPNQSSVAIANEFLRLRGSNSWPQQMLLQKLVYIAHGWSMAITQKPLVEELPEAWDNGPVYRRLWDHIRDYHYGSDNCLLVSPSDGRPYSATLNPTEKQIINAVWEKYAPEGADRLSEMTHEPGTPWFKAYFNRGRNTDLSNDDIKQHYTQLAMAGRE